MDIAKATQALLRHYPKIFFACHTRHVHDPASGRSLSAHQASILDHLDEREPTFVKDLAAHMGVTPSTISLALDRLQDAGYVRRVADANDARRVGVVLSAAGLRMRERSSVLDAELVHTLLASLAPADRKAAIAGLAMLASAASEMVTKRSESGQTWASQRGTAATASIGPKSSSTTRSPPPLPTS